MKDNSTDFNTEKALAHWTGALQEVKTTEVFLVGTDQGHDSIADFFSGYTKEEKIQYINTMIFNIKNPGTRISEPNPNYPEVLNLK